MFNKRLILSLLFIVVIWGLLSLQSRHPLNRIMDIPLYPLTWAVRGLSTLEEGINDLLHKYILLIHVYEENQALKAEVGRLKMQLEHLHEAGEEAMRLRRLLKLSSTRHDIIASARVIGRDPTNWFHMLWIDKGSQDGVKKDMIAISPSGLVGRLRRVMKDTSGILLITDINSSVAVRLQGSRIEGILEGDGQDACYMRYVPKDADVRIGERVITSGLDMIYPAGIHVGRVTDVFYVEGEMFLTVKVKPSVGLRSIEEVAIIRR